MNPLRLRLLLVIGSLSTGACLATIASPSRAGEPETKWEYKVLASTELESMGDGTGEIATGLGKLGDDGWELVSVVPASTQPAAMPSRYVFKRPKPVAETMADRAAGPEPAEIEVVGAYDQGFADSAVPRPLQVEDQVFIKRLSSSEQVRKYLSSLPDTILLKNYRHIQYRYLADGSLWDVVGWVSVRRTVESPVKLAAADVRVLPASGLTKLQEDRIAEAMATGWRPLGPGKEPGCAQCGGRGICPYCLGSGDPGDRK